MANGFYQMSNPLTACVPSLIPVSRSERYDICSFLASCKQDIGAKGFRISDEQFLCADPGRLARGGQTTTTFVCLF